MAFVVGLQKGTDIIKLTKCLSIMMMLLLAVSPPEMLLQKENFLKHDLHKDDIGRPQVEEGWEWSIRLANVGVVAARPEDGGAELCVAERPDHGQQAAHAPDDQGEANGTGLLQHALRGDKDA